MPSVILGSEENQFVVLSFQTRFWNRTNLRAGLQCS